MAEVGNPYQVLPITFDSGELEHVLVERRTWIPVRLATRWVVKRRRWECMPNTLAQDLRAVGRLYAWSDRNLGVGIDEYLRGGNRLTGTQIQSFLMDLRARGSAPAPTDAMRTAAVSTVAREAATVKSFLDWGADPINLGSNRPLIPDKLRFYKELQFYRAVLTEAFRPVIRQAVASQRRRPLEPDEVVIIDNLVGPDRAPGGLVNLPLRFGASNPFRCETRLRNWLMYSIGIQCGLRIGELLKLRIDDLPKPEDRGLKIRRRPHDSSDGRRHRPAVKTVERVLPISDEIKAGLRAYLTGAAPGSRRRGKTPYLFVTSQGDALSIGAANDVIQIVSTRSGIANLAWHTLRHTWAEGMAEDLMASRPEKDVIALLCELGGWKSGSAMPAHYTRNAWAKQADVFLRQRNERLYSTKQN